MDGDIDRTPLPDLGHGVGNLPHGLHQVTGGSILVGLLTRGITTRITGITVNDPLEQ